MSSIRFDDDRAFCQRINQALEEAGFDSWLENLCRPYCAAAENRSSLSNGLFFRLILISYLKENGYPSGNGSKTEPQSSPIELLGVSNLLPSRDGTNPTSAIYCLPLEIHRKVFTQALGIITRKGLLDRDATGPNLAGVKRGAVLTGLIHKETGEDWTAGIEHIDAPTPPSNPPSLNRRPAA